MKEKLKILKLLQKIPKGKITTYGILAKKGGTHPRTVGIIMKTNQEPKKYPCYKVVASDGRLGGYSAKAGISEKIALLKKDGIKIKNGRIADFEEKTYKFDNKS